MHRIILIERTKIINKEKENAPHSNVSFSNTQSDDPYNVIITSGMTKDMVK